MKKFILLLLFSQTVFCQEAEVKLAITSFFEAFHARDTIKLKSALSNELVLQSISEISVPKLTVESAGEFIRSIGSIPADVKFEERLLSFNIQIDGSMAHVWTPYEFYINGRLSHKGVNSFQLFKENGVWKIICLVDTRRKN